MLKMILSMFRKSGNSDPFSKVEVSFDDENLWVLWADKEKLELASILST